MRGLSLAAGASRNFYNNNKLCAHAAQAPYFCTDRNMEKSRWEPFRLGSQTLLNSQRDKLPFGNPYCNKPSKYKIFRLKKYERN